MERDRMHLSGRLTAASAIVVLLLTAAPAWAASVDDPDNARGPLDLKRLVANKHDATAPLRVRLVTYGTWPASLLAEDGQSRLNLLFNSDHTGRVDFIGEVFFRDGRLLMRIETRAGQFVRRVRVKHPTGSSITARIPHGLPNPDGNAWLAASERYQSETGFCVSICKDRIPGKGWLKVTPGQ
jgi:hypothetical protein